MIFHPADDALLRNLKEDGLTVEPEWFMPVVPLVLVNGAEGIGTGTFIRILCLYNSYPDW
jgi:DNA topoisomerase-2